MPVSRSTYGALSRSRATSTFSTSKTLVPFLYQTSTIQQCRPAFQIPHRSISSRNNKEDHVPFENSEALPPAIEDAGQARKTTITGSERAAFEKLYKNFSTEGNRAKDDLPFNHELDQIADEWYEEDDDFEPGPASIDAVFDAVLTGLPEGKVKKSNKRPENIRTLARRILQPESPKEKRKFSVLEVAKEKARVQGIREEERHQVQIALSSAKTDRALWDVLNREVFQLIDKLDLDGLIKQQAIQQQQEMEAAANDTTTETVSGKEVEKSGSSEKITAKPVASTPHFVSSSMTHNFDPKSDPRILFPNFPTNLVYAARQFRIYFPSSSLPFSILPTLKKLGRSSYALGASAPLYNNIIRMAWTQISSYDYVDELLTDMENGGIEFDVTTLETLDWIISEDSRAERGMMGQSIANIWRMEQFREGAQKIHRWRDVIAQRLGVWTAEVATSGVQIRATRTVNQTPRGGAQGPSDWIKADPKSFQVKKWNRRDSKGPKKVNSVRLDRSPS